jgi:hypothetical protein
VRTAIASLAILLVACNQAELVVVEAEQIGTVARSEWIQGRDGGGSAHAFGRSVWVYGDTVLEMEAEDGTNWHTNSYDLALPESWMTGFETPSDGVGAPRYFVELSADERAWNDLHASGDWALWPSDPQFDAERNRAWILYGLYNDELPSGIGIASWDGLDQPVVRRTFGDDDSYLLFPAPETEWGAGMVIDDDWLYAFGCRHHALSRPCMIGRAPLEDPSDRASWRFFDGDDWNVDSDRAEQLFDGAPIMELSWNAGLDRWLLIYSKPFDRDVVARTAESLSGPWSHEEVLFRAPGEAPYDAVHHPDLEEQDGLVQYITYSQPTTGWFGSEHQLWRVELARP